MWSIIEPHFVLDTTGFDEMQMYQRKHLLEESKRRPIYALCDGSHIFEDDDSIIVYGKAFLVKDGVIEQICDDRGSRNINQSQEKKYTKNKWWLIFWVRIRACYGIWWRRENERVIMIMKCITLFVFIFLIYKFTLGVAQINSVYAHDAKIRKENGIWE